VNADNAFPPWSFPPNSDNQDSTDARDKQNQLAILTKSTTPHSAKDHFRKAMNQSLISIALDNQFPTFQT
jgi:hypothetical protein